MSARLVLAWLFIAGFGAGCHRAHDDRSTGPVLGAAYGGYLGSRIGSGDGRIAAVVAGTLIGATIGTGAFGRPRGAEPAPTVRRFPATMERKSFAYGGQGMAPGQYARRDIDWTCERLARGGLVCPNPDGSWSIFR